uniref:Putative secreted protein n=1 Tax=Anopheles darlingi TaxID=43151 RepID=A0A2M4D2L9_ANODA
MVEKWSIRRCFRQVRVLFLDAITCFGSHIRSRRVKGARKIRKWMFAKLRAATVVRLPIGTLHSVSCSKSKALT